MDSTIGYQISNTHIEEQKALGQAFELVRSVRRIGADTRLWAKQTLLESRLLADRIEKEPGLTIPMKLWHIACLESKIILGLRNYMNETSDLMNGLRPLNPPLRSDQLKPFMEAMLGDRNTTVQAMEPLTDVMNDLTAFKLAHQTSEVHMIQGYSPSY